MAAIDPEKTRRALEHLHGQVDARAKVLQARHADRLACRRGCSGCCVDDLTVFEVEAENIRHHHPALLAEGAPHPAGRCAFLDAEGACRIYAQRPYVCRTQGLPLRWLEEGEDLEEGVEYRDICPLNEGDGTEPLEGLSETDLWTLGPVEGALAQLQGLVDGGEGRRVRLRDLFRKQG